MNGKNLQELIKNLQVFYKCPSCGSQYKHEDITFLGRIDEHCFMQLSCTTCSLPILATVLLSGQLKPKSTKAQKYYGSNVRKNDLARGERQRFSTYSPISSNEVADLHLYLTSHKTDLNTHF